MSKRRRRRKKRIAPKGSTREKGDIVEQITASMHQMPGVKVEQNVFLPAQDGSGRKREIDVLLSSQVAGHPVHVAIECKNEKKPVGVQKVGEFIDRLLDVGIPTQLGIYVSASGYTSGAISRAQGVGIRPLVLKEVTADSLSRSVREAFQALIYLLLTITSIQVRNNVVETTDSQQMLVFRNQEGRICGSIPDLVWQEWLSGKVPEKLGIYHIDLEVPDGWFQVVDGKVAQVSGVEVDVQVTGHIVVITGSARHLALLNASTEEIERSQIEAKFDMPPGTYPVTAFSAEEELRKFINRTTGINLSIGRLRLPRIRFGPMYWPPSESTARKAISLMRAFADGKIPDPRPLDLAEIEGTDMQKLWEPIWKEHPSAKKSES